MLWWQVRCWGCSAWPSIMQSLTQRVNPSKRWPSKKTVCLLCCLTHCQMPFSNSWEVWISLRLVEKMHMFTWRPIVRKKDAWWQRKGERDREHRRRGGRGGRVKWKRYQGTMELYKSKQVHLIMGSWQKQGWKNVVERADAEVRKCNAMMWLAIDVLRFRARPEHCLFVMPKYSGGKGIALWYFQPAAVTHVVAPGHAGLVRVWLMVMM